MPSPTATPGIFPWKSEKEKSGEYFEPTARYIYYGPTDEVTIDFVDEFTGVLKVADPVAPGTGSLADIVYLARGSTAGVVEAKGSEARLGSEHFRPFHPHREAELLTHTWTTKEKAHTDYLNFLHKSLSGYEAKIEETADTIDLYFRALLRHEEKLERAQEELREERWEKNLADTARRRQLMRVLRQQDWLGLRILFQLKAGAEMNITELCSETKKNVESVAKTLVELGRCGAIRTEGEKFLCDDSVTGIVEKLEAVETP